MPVEDCCFEANSDAVEAAAPSMARLRFRCQAKEPIELPGYAGSAWRGLLGHGLRRVACVTRQPNCEPCMLRFHCLYSRFFETPSAPDAPQRRYMALPHPFVLEPEKQQEREVPPGAALSLGMTLMGEAIEQVPYLIHALNTAGQRGFGRDGGRFSVAAVEREATLGSACWEPVYDAAVGEYRHQRTQPIRLPPPPSAVCMRLFTPLRVKRHGRFVGAAEFKPSDLLRNLCTRVAILAELYGGDPEPFDWRVIGQDATGIAIVDKRLRWHEWTRFSSRQNTRMQMGGLLGELVLEGGALPLFWPAIWLGQWVHVGKGTSFGLGGYRVLGAPPRRDDHGTASA